MVKDSISDGRRIGQLLASELTGLQRGPLSGVSVVDADRDVEPTPAGAFAYRVTADGTEVAVVEVTPETARLVLEQAPVTAPERDDITVDGTTVVVHSGAAVKTAVDMLERSLSG
ncbi:hypothetical protein BDK61_2513 [Haloarcula quadrata]|jgi:hypothetical protein|uniref:DUF7993 domain-containing protein n=2 Tax=Haloarcula TaxID=2237 RepID=M0K934_9EURY|nr:MULTISPECIES: hypothetical protein [Haloarcula]EMA16355.1 hypothetical protein C436_01240 [Haloarcula sinaiiensis ATCC 33800]NHN62412.1 hypothetical protein [Haloarcula sp. JP-Z28]NHX41458.1 hypothetical protein [Haloarcula sp. R1-2]QUJ72740.1 hypothetical protein KDQ40_03025 [Haloarcula sinaiiensis ATCC 33800]RKS83180.1 hypothetical protein BDK61_2513 [Haloarcula quadrata]